MKKVILFGASALGKIAYNKLHKDYSILYFVDNNPQLAGKELFQIPIISAAQMMEIYSEDIAVIVCSYRYFEIGNQLIELGIKEHYVMIDGFLYHTDLDETMIPVELNEMTYYRKEKNEKNILYVQNTACIRTHKLAYIMKANGYKVFLLYICNPPESSNAEFADTYDGVYTFFTHDAFINFVNNSDFDIIHSSNEPDLWTTLLLMTNKHIICDTHDMMSLRKPEFVATLTHEYIANVYSDGNMYTAASMVNIARKKYGLKDKEIYTIENSVLEEAELIKQPKLSSLDGEIHCVYEGSIIGKEIMHHRYFEKMWEAIAACGIHIHYYSSAECKDYRHLAESRYFHYEGNLGTKKLISEMTKYDCGLAMFQVNNLNRLFLSSTTSNKIYEYISAGLPVLVADVPSHVEFVEKYHVGKKLDFEKDIKEQIMEVSKIQVEDKFLTRHGLTMMSKGRELVDFYERVKEKEIVRKRL